MDVALRRIGALPLEQVVGVVPLVNASATSGCRCASSAISAICRPATEGMCILEPALTKRSSKVPVESLEPTLMALAAGLVRSNPWPSIR